MSAGCEVDFSHEHGACDGIEDMDGGGILKALDSVWKATPFMSLVSCNGPLVDRGLGVKDLEDEASEGAEPMEDPSVTGEDACKIVWVFAEL